MLSESIEITVFRQQKKGFKHLTIFWPEPDGILYRKDTMGGGGDNLSGCMPGDEGIGMGRVGNGTGRWASETWAG